MSRRLSRRGLLRGVLGAAMLGPSASLAAARRRAATEAYDVTTTELSVRGLHPAHDGLVIAQLSDIHVGARTPDGRVLAAVREVNELAPDLVVLTGDYVTSARDPLERVPLLLKGLSAPTFAVLGNHDHWSKAAERLRHDLGQLGYAVLQNEHSQVTMRGAPLTVLGIDDGLTRRADVARTFKGAPTEGSRVVLAHTPPTANELPPWQDLVCLSGHTHGGHFVIPGLTDGVFRTVGQPYVRGHYRVRGNHLYVNRGLGFGKGGPVVRLNSDPEVSLLVLRAAEPS